MHQYAVIVFIFQFSPPHHPALLALSPRLSKCGPIPFHLSPSGDDATSPMSPVVCASSPERGHSAAVSDDSFSQAFTSIKTTTDDSLSSRSHLLEQLAQTDSSICSLPEESSIETQRLDGCDKPTAHILSERQDVNMNSRKGIVLSVDGMSSNEDSKCMSKSKSNLENFDKPLRKTRFQNTIHSFSDNFDSHSFRQANEQPGGDDVALSCDWIIVQRTYC